MNAGFILKHQNPETSAHCISKFFFTWTIKCFRKANKTGLEIEDLYKLSENSKSVQLTDKLEVCWENELQATKKKGGKPSLSKAMYKAFGKEYMLWGFVVFIQMMSRTLIPIVLAYFVSFFSTQNRNISEKEMYIFGTLIVVITVTTISLLHHGHHKNAIQGIHWRVALSSLVYRKITRLSQTALSKTATGQIVNLISNDVSRIDMIALYLHQLWVIPIFATVVSYILWYQLGISCFVGIGLMVGLSLPLQSYLAKLIKEFRLKIAKKTDSRVRFVSEIVSGIKVIKMYAWEKPFEKLVKKFRDSELVRIKITSYYQGVFSSYTIFLGGITLYFTLNCYVLLGNQLTATSVFPSTQCFTFLQMAFGIMLPRVISLLAEVVTSIQRLTDFLQMEEKVVSEIGFLHEPSVKMVGVSAFWTPDAKTLKDITLHIPPGVLCAIVGPVGAGKSSLLQVLLGELAVSSGKVSVGGDISFASQQPWLFSASVKNNILLGQPYDKGWYEEVVRVCALERDFFELPYGDNTLVGDKGDLLSGGQKARVNLARAVYRKADVYIMDDPLSAVDTHVGKYLFDECIRKHLWNKTRILVTHQLQYVRNADLIVVMDKGRIEATGTFDELANKFDLKRFLALSENMNEIDSEDAEDEFKTELRKISELSIGENSILEAPVQHTHESVTQSKEESHSDKNVSPMLEYFKATNNKYLVTSLILLLVLAQVFVTAADFWVAYWTRQEEMRVLTSVNSNLSSSVPHSSPDDNSHFFDTKVSLIVYAGVTLTAVILTFCRSFLFFKAAMLSSKKLHEKMFRCLLMAPMRFFHSNPCGRILNRFSKDMGAIDEVLPKMLLDAIQQDFKRKILKRGALPQSTFAKDLTKKIKLNRDDSENTSFSSNVTTENSEGPSISGYSDLPTTSKKHPHFLPSMHENMSRIADNDNPSTNQEDSYKILRKNIMEQLVNVNLPDLGWTISRNRKSDALLFLYGDVLKNPFDGNKLCGIATKIVHMRDDKLVVSFHEKYIKLNNCNERPTNIQELEYILKKVDAYKICAGGPPATSYPSVILRAADKDKFVWRHKQCAIFLEKGDVCMPCLRIHKLLSQSVTRNMKKTKKKQIGHLSPRSKSIVSKLRAKNYEKTRIITRKEKKIQILYQELDQSLEKLKNIEGEKLEEQLKHKGVSYNQRMVIREILRTSKSKIPTGRRYSPEWLLNCLLLHIKSPTTYNLLRSQAILPLPCKSTINKYLKNSNVGVGFDDNFFQLFKKKLESIGHENPLATYGILAFDEMQVRKALDVNVETMTFSGLLDYGPENTQSHVQKSGKVTLSTGQNSTFATSPEEKLQNLKNKQADHALVFMFSSLGGQFHQPVGMFASRDTTPSCYLSHLIISAIIAIEKSGGKVMGLVCDGAKTNRKIWRDLGIVGKVHETVCSFENPSEEADGRKIYVFSDVPHLVKCIRNNLYNRKIFKLNQNLVKWEYYEKLYDIDKNLSVSARICPKITKHHINPTDMLKMRVFLATQIFSNSVADGLTALSTNSTYSYQFVGCEATIQFTRQINNMFDLLNGSNPYTLSADPKQESNKNKFFEEMNKCIEWLDDWEHEIAQEIMKNDSDKKNAIAADKKRQKEMYEGNWTDFRYDKEREQLINKEYQERKKQIENRFLSHSTAEGLRVTLKSTIELSKYLLESCNFKYVLTRKFNQDCLEVTLGLLGTLVNVGISNPFTIAAALVCGIFFWKIFKMYVSTTKNIKHVESIAKSAVFSHVSATIDGISTIRALKTEKILTAEFDQHQDVHTAASYMSAICMVSFGFWLDLLTAMFTACITYSFIIANYYIPVNDTMVGLALTQILGLTGKLQFGMRQLAEVANQLTSVERVLQYTKIETEGPLETLKEHIPKSTWPRGGSIVFQNVSLEYIKGDFPVLKNLCFTIREGEKIGIVGRTGAGKSSLISALFRLTDLDGYIYIDGVDIKTLGLNDLRRKISIIPQDPVLFSAELRYNLDPLNEYEDELLWKALEEVDLKSSVKSLDFMVSEGGGNFSLGQRQLICLARALLRKNKILVLDEATANVDLKTDIFIQSTIREKFKHCTVLTIAHRLNTIMDSDRVLVMSAGKSVEFDHPYLLLQDENGYFSKMVQETGIAMSQRLREIALESFHKESTIM